MGMSGVMPFSTEEDYGTKEKRNSNGGYERLGDVDEHEYEREEYAQHPMRVRTIKNGVSVPKPE